MQQSKYRIVALIGQGQFGRVFCAIVRQTGRIVALKELSHQRAPTHEFLKEFSFLLTLQHPNIVTCQAFEHNSTGRYLAMDYCEGGTLRQVLKQQNPLRLREGLQIILGILAGLEYTHKRGIVHCDIKPENILLNLHSQGWLARISDFGIARPILKTKSNHVEHSFSAYASVGSPAYIAPERFYGLYSPVSDIYSVGILLFETIMGYRPFNGNPGQLMWAHLNQRLQIPDVIPESLRDIIKKSLEKLPARRFFSAEEMAEAIKNSLADPLVQEIAEKIIPWQPEIDEPEDDQASLTEPDQGPIKIVKSLTIKSKKNPPEHHGQRFLLTANHKYLYGGEHHRLRIWHTIGETPKIINIKESIINLTSNIQGCWILAKDNIYFLPNNEEHLLVKILNTKKDLFKDFLSESMADQNPDISPISSFPYVADVDKSGRFLVVAIPHQIQFYSVRMTQDSTGIITPNVQLIKTIQTGKKNLPKLMFLDGKHILVIWKNIKDQQRQTVFRLYTRRGICLGDLRMPLTFAKLILTNEPYTILGLLVDHQPAAVHLTLWPLQVTRFLLSEAPVCSCVGNYGYSIADISGKITMFNRDGIQIGSFPGHPSPKAIANWQEKGLMIVSDTGEYTYLEIK